MSRVSIVELGKYTMPHIEETKNRDYITFGEKNSYFKTLLASKESPTNSALINGVSQMIYGKGLKAKDAQRKPDEYAMMIGLLKPDCLRPLCFDYYSRGQGALQVVYNQKHDRIVAVEHIPIQNLAPEKCNEEGEIEYYYYSDNWEDVKGNSDLQKIPAFGTSKEGLEILIVKQYKSGFPYFSPPEWQSGIDYAFVEIELAKFHLNNIHNRFSANTIINFNNGIPSEDERRLIEGKIRDRFVGSEGDGIIVAFNQNETEAATIENPQLADAHSQYSFIAEEASRKLMVSHKVTSPLLFGLPANSGFGSNADEIKMASLLFDNTVIKPLQTVVLDAIDKILSFNKASLNIYFETLQPLEFMDESVDQTQVKNELSSQVDFDDEEMLSSLMGEYVDGDWEKVDEREVNEENESVEDWAKSKIAPLKTGLEKLAGFITSKPSRESQLDKSIYKVRYSYEERHESKNSRKFCKSMMQRTSNGVVYRLEDIDKASRAGVNKNFGHKGAAYDLFKYKGGSFCGHYWQENLYRLKKKTDGSFVEDKALSSSQEVESIPKSYQPKPRGREQAKVAPRDMPNNGRYPS